MTQNEDPADESESGSNGAQADDGSFELDELETMHEFDEGDESGVTSDIASLNQVLQDIRLFDGKYKLLEQIGEGGMGEVWLAQESSPVQRKVAMKIMKVGMDTKEFVARFEQERQALALMDHPGIATMLAAGSTTAGRPYLVMEYVRDAEPITRYCTRYDLGLAERLALFVEVCHAVQHAHHKGIVHRDLKPANVLVTRSDGHAHPKVIDFGIAKALGQHLTDRTLHTGFLQRFMTLSYASPEQLEFGAKRVDTRSDVYSLGALLYELLCGEKVFEAESERDLQRKIEREDPVKPSVRLRRSSNAGTAKDESELSSKSLRGDIDAIVLKALEKSPEARYQHPSEFASDIGRHLANRPVTAQNPGTLYVIKKLMQRHRGKVVLGAAALLAIMLGILAMLFVKLQAARDNLLTSETSSIGPAMERLRPWLFLFRSDFERTIEEESAAGRSSDRALHASVALVLSDSGNEDHFGEFFARLLDADPSQLLFLLNYLNEKQEEKILEAAHGVLAEAERSRSQGLCAAAMVARLEPDALLWPERGEEIASWIAQENELLLGHWVTLFEPVQHYLVPAFQKFYQTSRRREFRVASAAVLSKYRDHLSEMSVALASYDERDLEKLMRLVNRAERRDLKPLMGTFRRLGAPAVEALAEDLVSQRYLAGVAEAGPGDSEPGADDLAKDALAREQARAGILLMLLGHFDRVLPALEQRGLDSAPESEEMWDPRVRTYLIHYFEEYLVDPAVILEQLAEDHPASVLQALILSLGNYGYVTLPQIDRKRALPILEAAWMHDDPGVHAAVDWLLEQWNEADLLAKLRGGVPRSTQPEGQRRWCMTPGGYTMSYIRGPQMFIMGSPESEPRRDNDEDLRSERIERSFLIANKTITRTQFERFLKDHPEIEKAREEVPGVPKANDRIGGEGRSPGLFITRTNAILYCNWLSQKEGLETCYLVENGVPAPKPDLLLLPGYRLPTEAEWEFACRVGTNTARSYGYDPALLEHYAWFRLNANDHTKPVGQLRPNGYGLFDMLGNVLQWCQDLPVEDESSGVVLRGSHARFLDYGVRSAYRQPLAREYLDAFFSVRVVRTIAGP